MVAHAIPREAKIFTEVAFATPPASWTASGSRLFIIDPDTSSVAQAIAENENIRSRAIGVNEVILTLRNCTASFGAYMHSSPVNAAEESPAVEIPLMTLLRNGFGGLSLTTAIGLASGTASAPVVDDDADLVIGQPVFAYDASTSTGDWYFIADLPGAAEVTLDRDLHFTPDAADIFYACGDVYMHELAITQHTHASHKTLSIYIQGQGTDDAIDLSGCKLVPTIEPITAGEPWKCSFEAQVTTFRAEELQRATLTGAIAGEAGLVPGKANTCKLKIAEVGDPLAAVLHRGSITPTVGLGYDPDSSPGGTEGRNGYVGTGFGECKIEIMVDYADSWHTAFRAKTAYHLLVTIGNTPTGSVAIYYPNLQLIEEPSRVEDGGLTSSKLVFRARDNEADPGALSGDDLERFLSPMHVMLVA